MPLQYSGVVDEHTAVRERVGLFDVSHLGKVTVTGYGARAFVDACLTNALDKIAPGQAQYTLCCDDETGGTVDDLIAYLRSDDDLLLIPNAANCAEVGRRLSEVAPAGVEVRDVHREYAVLAVQGTRSDETLRTLGLPTGHDYMAFDVAAWEGTTVTVCRTGYTGERGYELVVPAGRRRGRLGRAARRRRAARHPALRARGARHVAHRDGLSAARPGPVPGHQSRCRRGRAGPSGGTSRRSGDVTHSWRSGGRAGPAAAGHRRTRPWHPATGHGRHGRRQCGRAGHVGHVLTDPAQGHRVGSPAARRRRRHAGRGRGQRAKRSVRGRAAAVRAALDPRAVTVGPHLSRAASAPGSASSAAAARRWGTASRAPTPSSRPIP